MKNLIEKTTKDLIENLLCTETDFVVDFDQNGIYKILIQTKDEESLIGKENERFEAFSHLLKRILAKTIGEETKIIVDVNNIRGKNDDILKTKASIIAERARAFKKDMELDPMTSYERMVIHSHLEGSPNIKTESIGEGKQRRLVIRYTEEKTIV